MTTMLNRRDFIRGAATSVGAMTVMSSEMAAGGSGTDDEPERDLSEPRWCAVRRELLSVHPHPTGDEGHESRQRHPDRGVPMGSTPAPYAMIAHFQFASSEAVKAALANPAMAEVRADVAKFTDIKPTVMLGKSL
jgi:hypothetical protein